MNIDERLESLAQTVDLLVNLHHDNEKRMEQFEKRGEQIERLIASLARRNSRLEELVTDIAEGTARLLRTVEAHEQRLSDLEGNRPQ